MIASRRNDDSGAAVIVAVNILMLPLQAAQKIK
jgi:hypothetical protein